MPPGAKSFHIYAGGGDDEAGMGGKNRAREPLSEARRVRTVFLHNMSPDLTERELIKLIMPYGDVTRVNYAWHMGGELKGLPKGFATVEFKYVSFSVRLPSPPTCVRSLTPVISSSPLPPMYLHREQDSAARAIAGLSGREFFGRTLYAREYAEEPTVSDDPATQAARRRAELTASLATFAAVGAGSVRDKIRALERQIAILERDEDVPPGGAGEEALLFPEQAAAAAAAAEKVKRETAEADGYVRSGSRYSGDRYNRGGDRDSGRGYGHGGDRGGDRDSYGPSSDSRRDRERSDRERGDRDRSYGNDRDYNGERGDRHRGGSERGGHRDERRDNRREDRRDRSPRRGQ
jgi:hypothetical protein